ncbi:MAG: hypothetical protein CL927_02200, partial [Deltaproteobacteria bacterium]|nr:hypothetical protein [Deltaproteobacteria bacterium]
MTPRPSSSSQWWRVAQLTVSVVVIGLLFRDLDRTALSTLLPRIRWDWLALVFLVKAATLFLHEFRLWISLNPPRPALGRVIAIGLASGVLN